MARTTTFYGSSVGKKVIMAVTGGLMALFLVMHMLGNLQVFEPGRLDKYAHFLKSTGELLWAFRTVMLVALILHVIFALSVYITDWKARPVGYNMKKNIKTGYAARTMVITGPIILAYLIYHLMMFTWLSFPGYEEGTVFANVTYAFSKPVVVAVYIVAMLALGFHLFHGLWSLLQSLGINHPKFNRCRRIVTTIVAIIIALGFIIVPLAVILRIVH